MAIGCDCNAGLSDTGRPNCVPLFSVVNNIIQVPLYANDGTANKIDLTSLPTWSNLINETDASKRWFPIPTFENVELPKADSQFEESNSGRMAFLRQGKRSFSGELWADESTTTFLGKLEKGRCVEFGVYIIDVNGNLIGSKVGTDLYPIPVDNDSWNPVFNFATDSTVQKIVLSFDLDRLFEESTMYQISSVEGGVDFTTLKGLIDVNLTSSACGQTASTLSATLDYGTAVNAIKAEGLINTADWGIYNNTTTSSVAVSTVTESPAGTYAIGYASQSVSDELVISVARDGFDGEVTAVVV